MVSRSAGVLQEVPLEATSSLYFIVKIEKLVLAVNDNKGRVMITLQHSIATMCAFGINNLDAPFFLVLHKPGARHL